jgi:hypothetical protein
VEFRADGMLKDSSTLAHQRGLLPDNRFLSGRRKAVYNLFFAKNLMLSNVIPPATSKSIRISSETGMGFPHGSEFLPS